MLADTRVNQARAELAESRAQQAVEELRARLADAERDATVPPRLPVASAVDAVTAAAFERVRVENETLRSELRSARATAAAASAASAVAAATRPAASTGTAASSSAGLLRAPPSPATPALAASGGGGGGGGGGSGSVDSYASRAAAAIAATTTPASGVDYRALAARADALEETVRRQSAALTTMQAERTRMATYARRYEAGLARRGGDGDSSVVSAAGASGALNLSGASSMTTGSLPPRP